MKPVLIGVTGFARSGKDTLAEAIKASLLEKGKKCQIFSLAHALKSDLNDFCLDKFGISAFTENSESKAKIRPLLVAYGIAKRNISNGRYWVDKLKKEIDSFFSSEGGIAIVPDIRFKEYDYDEYDFVRSYDINLLIHVSRMLETGKLVGPAHETEEINSKFLYPHSDEKVLWPSNLTKTEIENFANPLAEIINRKYTIHG